MEPFYPLAEPAQPGGDRPARDLFGDHRHRLQHRATEGRHHRDVGGVPAAADQDPALAAHVVPRVEGPPPVTQPDLHPGREVHRVRVDRHVHVRQVPEDVPGRDVHRPAEGDGQVGEVAAHAVPGGIDVDRGRCRRTAAVGELQVVVDVLADRLHAGVTAGQLAEPGPGLVAEHVGQAVPARHQVDQHVVRQLVRHQLGRRSDRSPRWRRGPWPWPE